MSCSLANRVAVVTGGSRGIGRAISLELARRGAFVVINYRRNDREAEKTLAALRSIGGRGRLYRADVSQPDQVREMFVALYREHQGIDVLVNNAGVTRDEYFLGMRGPAWEEVLNTNLGAVFHCCRAAAPAMCAAGRGVILNIGSGASVSPRPGQVHYSGAKAGLIGFSRSLARDLAGRGVRVLVVAPGFTKTDMTEVLPPHVVAETVRMIPLGRWGLPEELAGVVAYLASEEAAFLTGQAIMVDGGRSACEPDYGF